MSLTSLLKQAGIDAQVSADVEVRGITSDSRQVQPGFVFVAIAGTSQNGAHYVSDALARGAVAIVGAGEGATVQVADARAAAAKLASAFYAPAPRYMLAVTGTDGKTSTADFVRQLATLLGDKAASIGTLGLRSPEAALNAAFPANNTSPEPVLLHRTLASLAASGVTHVAVEASSHGLDQKRLEGVQFTAAAYTNLTRDHLDYHGTPEAYAAAKARLFVELLPEGKTAVLNRDDAQFEWLQASCHARGIRVRSFGTDVAAELRIAQVTPHAGGLDAELVLDGVSYPVSLPLYGAFQLMNMLAAMGLLEATGVALADMVPLLPQLKGVPGRLEKIAEKNGAPMFVDYAHTPAALANILKTLRPHTEKKLHVVFGCGGDRDAGKRPEMGRAATELADVVVVTDDNPRSENPAAIRAAIMAAAPGAQEIGGRDEAIATAIKHLQPGDVLVVAGKGHETSQTIGTQVIHFSDAEHIRKAVGQ